MDTQEKIKPGWFSCSCCEDSTIVMTEIMNDDWKEWKNLFDFRHAQRDSLRCNKQKPPFVDFQPHYRRRAARTTLE